MYNIAASEAECNYGDLRLRGGSNLLEGRVEVCLGGDYGIVCDDRWGSQEATVVCSQLGFSPMSEFNICQWVCELMIVMRPLLLQMLGPVFRVNSDMRTCYQLFLMISTVLVMRAG